MRALYDLVAIPLLGFGVALTPGGKFARYGYGAGFSFASSPSAKNKAQDIIAGEKQERSKKSPSLF